MGCLRYTCKLLGSEQLLSSPLLVFFPVSVWLSDGVMLGCVHRRGAALGYRHSGQQLEQYGSHPLAAWPNPVRPLQPDTDLCIATSSLARHSARAQVPLRTESVTRGRTLVPCAFRQCYRSQFSRTGRDPHSCQPPTQQKLVRSRVAATSRCSGQQC